MDIQTGRRKIRRRRRGDTTCGMIWRREEIIFLL
jgi:hypothetical protein